MLLQEPGHSPYDLRFHVLGFPVRVSWSFWLAGVIFGFSLVRSMDEMLGLSSPGMLPLLMLWSVCLLVSILIHELGHALAFRQNGMNASIVLYHFGGLAIPTSSYSPDRFHGQLTPKQDIWISFAGPLAQFVSAMVLVAAVKAAGYQAPVPWPLTEVPGLTDGKQIDSHGLYALLLFYIFPSVLWAILNLVPVWPLDGGHISSSIVKLRGGDDAQALWISVIAAGLLAAYGFFNGQQYMGFLFLVLGVTNFQTLQQSGGYR
jgi:stage IV sporulation protein FB